MLISDNVVFLASFFSQDNLSWTDSTGLLGSYHLLPDRHSCGQSRLFLGLPLFGKSQPSSPRLPDNTCPGQTDDRDGDAEQDQGHHGVVRTFAFIWLENVILSW